MKRYSFFLVVIILFSAGLLVACQSQNSAIEVTRIDEAVVTRITEVEVTRVVEVTRAVEIEVTRIVEVQTSEEVVPELLNPQETIIGHWAIVDKKAPGHDGFIYFRPGGEFDGVGAGEIVKAKLEGTWEIIGDELCLTFVNGSDAVCENLWWGNDDNSFGWDVLDFYRIDS